MCVCARWKLFICFGSSFFRYVIVFNCSDGVDYKMTGTMFAGLSQTGAWACLDEFNRIEVEVLSVVASQISEVMQAIKAGLDRFVFMGTTLNTCLTCGRSIPLWTKFENWNKNQSQIVDHPKEDLAKFGYRSDTQVNNIRILLIFWLHIGTILEEFGKCFFPPSKILQITHLFFFFFFPPTKNPFYVLKSYFSSWKNAKFGKTKTLNNKLCKMTDCYYDGW